MKKKILAVVLGLTLCLGMTGCTSTGSKNYDDHSKLVSIEGENDLYYYATTHIVYIVFNEIVVMVICLHIIRRTVSYALMILIQNR